MAEIIAAMREQPDAITLQISRFGGSRRRKQPTSNDNYTPLGCVPVVVFRSEQSLPWP
jgi:hypothetical protein